MFGFLKKSNVLYAPVKGQSIRLADVPDPVFAEKLLGDGVAFTFDTDVICAPCDCEIIMVADTKHAIGIRLSNKAEVMIHIGLDTVNLDGEGFKVLVNEHEKVKKGQPIVKIDRKIFEKNNINLITPMIITSKDQEIKINEPGEVDTDTVVIQFQ